MGEHYYAPNGPSFNDLYEPDSNGVVIPGYYDVSGNPLRYAPINLGSRAQDAGFYHPDGPDVSNYWAARGSVGYTNAMGDIGSYDGPYADCFTDRWYPARGNNHLWLKWNRNGTWSIGLSTRNYTSLVARSGGGGIGYMYPDGKEVAAGNWAQNPRGDFGDSYTISVNTEQHENGRWWIPMPANPATWQWQPGAPGRWLNSTWATISGLGNDMPCNQDRIFELVCDLSTQDGNWVYRDPNASLRIYNRGWLRVVVKRNGNPVLNFRFLFCMVNTYQDLDIIVREGGNTGGGSGGGGGGGGGGGCVATEMWMDTERQAHEIAIGDWIDGSAYNPDIMTPRQVRANRVTPQPCFRIVTESGISIVASNSTPMTMRDGSCKMFGPRMYGEEVFVNDRGELRWERVREVQYVGVKDVVLFNVNDQSYFAGEQGDRRIATHNASEVKEIQ